MIADGLTKPLSPIAFKEFIKSLGLTTVQVDWQTHQKSLARSEWGCQCCMYTPANRSHAAHKRAHTPCIQHLQIACIHQLITQMHTNHQQSPSQSADQTELASQKKIPMGVILGSVIEISDKRGYMDEVLHYQVSNCLEKNLSHWACANTPQAVTGLSNQIVVKRSGEKPEIEDSEDEGETDYDDNEVEYDRARKAEQEDYRGGE